MLWLVLFLQARSVLILCANTLCPVFTFLKLALSGSFLLAAEMVCRLFLSFIAEAILISVLLVPLHSIHTAYES